jgi:hypothetical protein|nr:MAG TPA: hypothetical protein [Caudoviricetes sp.]
MNTFDFEYSFNGSKLVVEVDFYYSDPDPYADNDWDYSGGLSIDTVRIYSGTDEVFDVNLPIKEIEYQFRKYLEEKSIEEVMESNLYF